MYQEIPLSDRELREMYDNCSKDALIEMVIEANKTIDILYHSTSIESYHYQKPKE